MNAEYLSFRSLYQPNFERYVLTGAGVREAEADDCTYKVLPFCFVGARRFWIAVSVDVVAGHRYRLAGVRLVIFEGEASDILKSPLLRAEWESQKADVTGIHAQPHWHVYASQLIHEKEVAFEPEMDTRAFVPDIPTRQRDKGEKFHFAMASQWHKGGRDSHVVGLDCDGLFKWLDGCLSYIRNQLLSLS